MHIPLHMKKENTPRRPQRCWSEWTLLGRRCRVEADSLADIFLYCLKFYYIPLSPMLKIILKKSHAVIPEPKKKKGATNDQSFPLKNRPEMGGAGIHL